jgi:hypothetical protein
MGISDPSIAALFGLRTDNNPTPQELLLSLDFSRAWKRLRGGTLQRFEARMIVVADRYGRVRKIFRHATLPDIYEALRRAGFAM